MRFEALAPVYGALAVPVPFCQIVCMHFLDSTLMKAELYPFGGIDYSSHYSRETLSMQLQIGNAVLQCLLPRSPRLGLRWRFMVARLSSSSCHV